MFADQKLNTDEALCYEVPVLGIKPQYKIRIIRSLRPLASAVSISVKSKGNIYI